MKKIKVVIGCMLSLAILASSAVLVGGQMETASAQEAVTEESYEGNKPTNLFYSFGNIYKSYHQQNGEWWDGENALSNSAGSTVTYNADYTEMTVKFNGDNGADGKDIKMWGKENNCFDLTDAEYLIIYARNNAPKDSWFSPMLADKVNTSDNFNIAGGKAKLVDGTTAEVTANAQGCFALPAGFDGYVAIDKSQFSAMWEATRDIDWTGITRISYSFEWYVSDITFGEVGWAISEEAVDASVSFVRPIAAGVSGFSVEDKIYDGTPTTVHNGNGSVEEKNFYKYEDDALIKTQDIKNAGIYLATLLYTEGGKRYYCETTFNIEKKIPSVTVTPQEVQMFGEKPNLGVQADAGGTLTTNITALAEGINNVKWTFTPEDTENYEVVQGTATVTVEVATKEPDSTTSEETTNSSEDAKEEKKSGCGSVLGTGLGIMTTMLGGCAVALFRKKHKQ